MGNLLGESMVYIYKGIHGEIIWCCIGPQYRLILGDLTIEHVNDNTNANDNDLHYADRGGVCILHGV